MIFKTTLTDINKMAVAIDKISTMTLPNYSRLGIAIEGLTAKQAALVLSTRNLSQVELEEVIRVNNLIEKYGAEQLVKTGLLSANSSLLTSEKTVNAEKLRESIIQSALNKEKAEEFIQTQLSIVSDEEEIGSTVILSKALMDEAVKRGILTKEKATDILSTYGVVAADKLEIGSKKGLIKTIGSLISANASLIASTVGITALISILYQLSKVTDEVRNKAQELGDSFKETSSTIDDYKLKIIELYKVINDESSSIEDTTSARKSLLSIQDELIDKFGTEESVISNVTEAINGQTEALDKLSKAKWQEAKNDFTHGGFWNDAANFFQDTNNIERMLNEYGKKTVLIKWADYADINELTDEMVTELENIGIDIKVSTDNLQAVRDFDSLTESIEDTKGASLSLSGNAEDIYNKLLALQNLIGNDDSFDKLYDKVGDTADSYKELTDKYKNFYDQYILQEKIFADDSKYADTFKSITDAAKKYNEAFTSGDETKIKESADEYASILSSAMSTAITNGDSDVATYFENMYPTLKSIVDGWNFNIAFDSNTEDLQSKVQNVLNELKDKNGRSFTAEEILGLGESNAQYQSLVAIAHSYNMTLEEMIELLKERNLVSAMDYQGLVGLFGQENVDKLSTEDLEIAYTIKNVGNMTFEQLQSEIQKTKETADEMGISSLSITQTIDQLNTQLKPAFDSLKSAYQDIFTTDDNGKPLFTLENVDLSMLDSIKSAIDDLNENEELGISIDYSSFETLADVLTNSESTAEDVKNAINGLAGTIVQSLNPSLQSTTAETYQLTKSMLESLGVANAEEVMISALGYSLTELSALRKAASDAGFDLANATDNEISMFIWEQTEAGNCAQELYALQLKKVLLNSTTINTSADIEYILGLANSAGIASNALVKLAEAKQMLDTANANGDVRGIYEAKKYANQLRDEIQNDVISFKVPEINFDGTDKSKSSKSGGSSSKSEKDLWLEEYKRKLEELKRQLNEGRLMPSSTVMWNK